LRAVLHGAVVMDALRAPAELKKAIKEIMALVQSKVITKKQGKQMTADARVTCTRLLAGGVPPAAGQPAAPADLADAEGTVDMATAPKAPAPAVKKRATWPCGELDECEVAEVYSTYEAGFIAVAKAWGEDTLLPGLGSTKAQVAPGRKHGPAGAGERDRGYVDYEFLDGNGMRYLSSHIISRMYHAVSRCITTYHVVSYHTPITYHDVSQHIMTHRNVSCRIALRICSALFTYRSTSLSLRIASYHVVSRRITHVSRIARITSYHTISRRTTHVSHRITSIGSCAPRGWRQWASRWMANSKAAPSLQGTSKARPCSTTRCVSHILASYIHHVRSACLQYHD
jgi:hypothetical protein